MDFDVVIERDGKTGQVYASVPSLPGCYSYADTIESLLKSIKEAIELHLSSLKEKGQKRAENKVVGMVKVAVAYS
ncbi:MAG: type II toxin-antitoxin system HicB family antitoxin [archaeon]